MAKSYTPTFMPNPEKVCLRCLRNHPGGEEKCKSLERACKNCGFVGHFKEVHDVTDSVMRTRVG